MRSVFFYKPLPPSPPSRPGWRWYFSVWTPVVIAVAIICVESTSALSSQNTSGWLRPIIQYFVGTMQDARWDLYHQYLRKSGHFIGYGLVAVTFLRAWLHTLDRRAPSSLLSWRLKSTLLAILSTAFIASCDEFHQAFIPSRTGSPIDVLLDTAGACALCLLVWFLCWSRRQSSTELIAA